MRPFSIKTQLIIFLSIFAAYLSFADKDALFLLMVLVAVAGAVAVESIILLFKIKKFVVTESSAISGLIIGFVVSGICPWWMFLAAPVLAICSKHLIRISKRHLLNPAASGILLAVILLGASTAWRGAGLWYILIPAGIYFVVKIRKIEVIIGYVVVFLALFGTQAFFQKTPLTDVLIYQNYFFIFVMLIEPKTTPITRKGKVVFGAAVAILVFILTISRVRFEAELLSLLAVNAFSSLLNRSK